MEQIYDPYVQRVIIEEGLNADQKSVLLLDCYPVHTGVEFRSYVKSHFPNVIILFVPANCICYPPTLTIVANS